jgi:hypothetical protein
MASLLAGQPAEGLDMLDDLIRRRADDEPSLALALLTLYQSLTAGPPIEGPERDKQRLLQLADVYRSRGGPSRALVDAWVSAVTRPEGRNPR